MALLSYNKFNIYSQNILRGVHNFTSDGTCTLTVALCAAANAPVATSSVLVDLTQIVYTNLSSRVITGVTATQTSGTCPVTMTDLTLTATGNVATFRYIVIYDDDPTSPADPLLCWMDYGSNISLTSGQTLLIDAPTNLFTLS